MTPTESRAPGVFAAWRDGVRRVNGAPAIVFGIWALTLLLALPLAVVLRGMLGLHLGSSLAANAAAEGVNYEWWNEFLYQASGIGTTFVPSIIGFAAPLRNISGLLDKAPLAATMASIVAAWLVLWALLAGGIFDRYARARTTHTPAFFSACGVFFFRFVRLGLIAFALYFFLFAHVHHWLLEHVYEDLTHTTTVERNAFFIKVGLYLVFALLLALVNLLVDYAKVRAVVEDRRSMIGALAAARRFITRHPAVFGLYLLNAAVFLLILLAYRIVAPGAQWNGAWMWVAFAVSQVYILARAWAKLVFAASEIALFQSRLAHTGYAAFPGPPPAEPPIVEALGPPAIPPVPRA